MGKFPLAGNPEARDCRQSKDMNEQASGLSPQELMEVRIRVAGGFYDHPAVFLAAAEKILEKGDIETRG